MLYIRVYATIMTFFTILIVSYFELYVYIWQEIAENELERECVGG